MTLLVEAELKCGVTEGQVQRARRAWVRQGKDRRLKRLTRMAQRLVVAGSSPRRVLWLMETKDPSVVELITEHFGSLWNLTTSVVLPQTIGQALK